VHNSEDEGEMTRRFDGLEWAANAWVVLAVLSLCVGIVRYAHGEDKVRCAESPGKGEWHSRQVEGRRCWFKGHSGKYRASELYWAAPEQMEISQPVSLPSEMEYRWQDPRCWSHKE